MFQYFLFPNEVVDADEVGEDIEDGFGFCGSILIGLSFVLILFTCPFSLVLCIKVKLKFLIRLQDVEFLFIFKIHVSNFQFSLSEVLVVSYLDEFSSRVDG